MKKKATALALAAALVLSLAGCAAPASGETTVHLQTEEEANSIAVSGRVGMEVVPDVVQVTVGVNSRGSTPSATRQDNTAAINSTLEALAQLGIEEKDIQTSNMNMYSSYSYNNGNRTLIGYEMDTTLTILVREIDLAGDVIDAAIDAGSNSLNGVRYLVSNRDEVYDKALTDAVELARQKAEALAAVSGRSLGIAIEISEVSDAVASVYDYEMTANADSGGMEMSDTYRTSLRPGSTTVEAEVRVVFELV